MEQNFRQAYGMHLVLLNDMISCSSNAMPHPCNVFWNTGISFFD